MAVIADEKSHDAFTGPAGEIERAYYGYSRITCLPAAMTDQPTAAIGTVTRADSFLRSASEAGFSGIERLDEPALDMLRVYASNV